MKYKLTWKDIFIANSLRYICIGFPLYLIATFFVVLLIQFFNGTLGELSFSAYFFGFISLFPTLIIIYGVMLCVLIITYFRYWKHTIIGEHELTFDSEFFIWTSARGEVRTKLSLLKNFTIKRTYFTIKFEGAPVAKIQKKWIYEGYDEFVAQMTKILSKKD